MLRARTPPDPKITNSVAFLVYNAVPPADPCQQGFSQKEFSTEEEALEYVLASRKAAVEAGIQRRKEYCIKTIDGETVFDSNQIILAFNKKESGSKYSYR
jgi:hypothetical protein